jgi:Mrp family chromosome partitioning ATPase
MTVDAIANESKLSLTLPIGGGLKKTVRLAKRDLHPALVFAHDRTEQGKAEYQRVTDSLLRDDIWDARQVFVSSAQSGDGKTSTAFNLAWALALRKKSVLLVELNLLQPRFRSVLGDLRIRHGIDSALRGSAKPEESVFSIGSDGLHICAVRDAFNKAETLRYLSSLTMFFDWAGDTYEWLVFDCPPVLSSAWNNWFQEHASPVLLVVRAHCTSLLQVRKVTQRLGDSLKGTLLNAAGEPMASSVQKDAER